MKTERPQDPMGTRKAQRGAEWDHPVAAPLGVPTEWEHKQVACAEDADLSPLAAGGWELVTVVPSQNHHGWVTAYFKRPHLHASATRPPSEQV